MTASRGLPPGSHRRLYRQDQGTINANTRIYLTHINHTHTATHAELSKFFAEADLPCKIEVGYDGMEIED